MIPSPKSRSTRNADQPWAGCGTKPTYTPPPRSDNGELVHAGPMLSNRKSRAFGLCACHSLTECGVVEDCTRIEPSGSKVQLNCGSGSPSSTLSAHCSTVGITVGSCTCRWSVLTVYRSHFGPGRFA